MPAKPRSPSDRAYRQAAVGAWVGIVGNVALGAAKLVGGVLGTSTALVADAAHSLSDSVSSVIVLVGLKRARRPADLRHPFGHGKAEFIAARTVAVLLMVMSGFLAWRAVVMIVHPPEDTFPRPFVLWFVGASILVKEAMYQYKNRLGKRLQSESLTADAWHHRSDAFSSVCALAGITAALLLGHEWRVLDPIAALAIVGILFLVGLRAYQRTGSALMDEVADEATVRAIRDAAAGVEGVCGIEKILSRRSGLETQADLHVEVDPEITVRQGHAIASAVSGAIRRAVPAVTHVSVHIEPHDLGAP